MGEVGIFILLSLPFSLIQFVFNPKTISDGTKMNWEAVPWGQVAVLFGIGILLSFFLSGYGVRIYRGVNGPDFTDWTNLFFDGLKLAVVWFLWMLPLVIVLAAGALFTYMTFVSSSSGSFTKHRHSAFHSAPPSCGVYPFYHRYALWDPRCCAVCPDGQYPRRDQVFCHL